ncbi:hypothetical protein IG631_20663 [Alternaria alternata]|nr:hypothetical protein IG631_20663 [Alternaria alternata]
MSKCSTLVTQHASRTDSLHITLTEQTIDKWRDECELVAGIVILRPGTCLTQCSPEASQVSVANSPPKDSKLVHAMPEGNKLPKPLRPRLEVRTHGLHLDNRTSGLELGANMSRCFGMELWECFV